MISHVRVKSIQFEVNDLMQQTKLTPDAVVLDMGCGNGQYLHEICRECSIRWPGRRPPAFVGVDISIPMLTAAEATLQTCLSSRFPKESILPEFIQGDFTNDTLLPSAHYTHVLTTYFTLYLSASKAAFVQVARNVHKWLQPSGYWVVHIVHPDRFDPILDASNVTNVLIREFLPKSRQNQSRVEFDNNLSYECQFQYDAPSLIATFHETFTERSPAKVVRVQEQQLFMPLLADAIHLIETAGMRFVSKTQLKTAGSPHQYMCYFVKPTHTSKNSNPTTTIPNTRRSHV